MPTLSVVTVPPKFANHSTLALRQPCHAVNTAIDTQRSYAQWVVQELFETLYTLGTGVGLAAPQLGVLQRVLVIDDEKEEPLALVNPIITQRSDEVEFGIEGCLSMPGYIGQVPRSQNITVSAISPAMWQRIEIKAAGYRARVLQHEIDHLDGVLFIDHLPNLDALERSEPFGVVRARSTMHKLKIQPTIL